MNGDSRDLSDIFDGVIHRYTRAQALDDGVLVDVTETAREVGFSVSVAMTSAAWSETVEWTMADSVRQTLQDESGRLWDVLWIAYQAARRASGSHRLPFELYVVPRDGFSTRPRSTILHLHIGPGDAGEPVLTILKPNED